MTCRHATMLIHLNRPGDLSEGELRRLREHLARCVACQLETERVHQSPLEDSLPGRETLDDNRIDNGVAKVLQAIETLNPADSRHFASGTRLSHIILSPRFRLATSLATALCVLTFLVQGVLVMRDLSHIEATLSYAANVSRSSSLHPSFSSQSFLRQRMGMSEDPLQAIAKSVDSRLMRVASSYLSIHAKQLIPTKH